MIYETVLTIITSGGVSIAVATFLSKKILDHSLEKDINKFRTKLDTQSKLLIEERKFAFHEEILHLKAVWGLICEITEICQSYKSKDISKLSAVVSELDSYLTNNEPNICDDMYKICREICETSDPDFFSINNSLNNLLMLRESFVIHYRARLYLD
jgi:hypothetical protein